MSEPRITLDQWRALVAVVDKGGYAKAAAALHKSQSSVTYGVQQLESQLGVKAFKIAGRKAELTSTGELLYRRARYLVGTSWCASRAPSAPALLRWRRRSAGRSVISPLRSRQQARAMDLRGCRKRRSARNWRQAG